MRIPLGRDKLRCLLERPRLVATWCFSGASAPLRPSNIDHMIHKFFSLVIGLVVAILLGLQLAPAFGGPQQQALPQLFTNGIYVGDQGTILTDIVAGTCNASNATSLAASSSGQFVCSAIGARSGDLVFVSLPAGAGANVGGAASLYGGFVASIGYATTSDVVGFNITNLTGAATTSFRQATTSVQYWIVR